MLPKQWWPGQVRHWTCFDREKSLSDISRRFVDFDFGPCKTRWAETVAPRQGATPNHWRGLGRLISVVFIRADVDACSEYQTWWVC